MRDGNHNPAACVWGWLARRPGYMLLSAPDERLAAEPPERFRHAWIGLMAVSLLWGLVLLNLWGIAWKVFRDYDPLVMPAMVTAGLFCLWPFRRGIAALADLLAGRDATGRAVTAAALVLLVAFGLLGLKPDWDRWEHLPWWLTWLRPVLPLLRPQAKLYRVLVLMPLWGGWAMVIAVKFSRPTPRTEPQIAAFARGCGALVAAACMAVLLLVSIAYFCHLGTGSVVILCVVPILAAIAGGVGFCWRAGGPTRRALLSANVATQIAFLVTYLAGR